MLTTISNNNESDLSGSGTTYNYTVRRKRAIFFRDFLLCLVINEIINTGYKNEIINNTNQKQDMKSIIRKVYIFFL